MRRSFALAVLFSFAVPAFAAEPLGLTEDEFKMFQHYKIALGDARVQGMKPEARLAAIAKDSGVKPKALQQAIAKGEAAGDVKGKCEANLKEMFAKGELEGRVGKIEIDTSAAHAVAYVQWFNEEPKNLATEASFAAARAAEGCPIASTITVWAQDKAVPKTRVFQALVSSASARRINVDRVKDFAETRYLKLFEKVKSVTNGDDLSTESGTPTAQP